MPQTCSNRVCDKTAADDGTPLQQCARCEKAVYCSIGLCPGSRRDVPVSDPSLFLLLKKDTYGIIIDTFRLRCEDDYVHGCHNHSIYGGEEPLPVFNDFLDRAETAYLMPSWWEASKRAECIKIALEEHTNLFIGYCMEKSDIQETYNDNFMPMKMRMMAECIYGGGYGMGQTPMPKGFQCFCQP